MNQPQMSEINKMGWNQNAYQAWVTRHGKPADYAEQLKVDPSSKVSFYLDEIGVIRGKRVLNLLGSKGNKAVCFALLGADVTVVDLSSENKRYAMELAEAAGVSLTYIVKDVLELTEEEMPPFDIVILEMGVLHYFVDLHPLFQKVSKFMKEKGSFIIRDYHPFISKAIRFSNGEAILDGNYFREECLEVDVAYAALLPKEMQQKLEKNIIRQWMLSEVVNALITSGLKLRKMKEDKGVHWAFPTGSPEGIAERLPGTFTICASL
ncbi:bifunctional 2-polyprenyl-6-hydroxyphenol methylase/3-demethylubiquinol 3-O-methyltransferase UbiG [Sporosarcina sp. Marseille-Q4943]|uniref:class I SAM-dependent methyltransferase n=1 Tax=Sporosarcina sp. Marseille-Q4943 TaxID=2942204 RepID=UPI00208DC451|nr:methyltransferase domain-containing protein [Sporosarcina sp. Marseille-Q4943]